MPFLTLLRIPFTLLSLAILGTGGWLLWSWFQGEWVWGADGALVRARDDWRLWLGGGLLAWSFLGRFVVVPLLARPGGPPSRAHRLDGQEVTGASGSTLYVETSGPETGPVLILTHGWGLDSTIWNCLRGPLAERFRIVAWDLPGLGRSRPAKSISLSAFAADLRGLVEGMGRPVVLVGHSIGGMTIQTLAREHPDLFGREVAGVVLLNTTHTNPLQTMVLSDLARALRWPLLEPMLRMTVWLQPLAWLSAWQSYLSGWAHVANRFGFGRYVTRSQLEHTTLLATRNPPGAQALGNLAMFRWDAGEGLARLSVPTLVLGGDLDLITRLEASRTIATVAPAARLEIIEGVNHMGFLERADVYGRQIAAFADTLTAAGKHVDRAPRAPYSPPAAAAQDEAGPDLHVPIRPGS
ncbi:MAG TPA: alpha/beta hydrolase [Caulobacter sp.]|nr:alpha/beta hydrolase [Caulobacter sp.]